MRPKPPLWQCPRCGERFVTRNLSHSCGKFSIGALFAGSEPHVLATFDRFADIARACGPITIIPQKTRIAFQARIRFAAIMPRKSYLIGGLLLPRRIENARFLGIDSHSARCHEHKFRLDSPADLDSEFVRWIREAYEVGEQKHLE